MERPSSAIKELLENSADAGATKITVEIKNGGSTYIRVSDNGCGISAEDVPVCILRHATSKIRTKDDLEAISTLGFRGEALAAIAAVTRLRIMTRRAEDASGTYFEAEFGEKKSITETGCPVGTTIIAEDLFENVPARRKFLRRDVSETKAVAAVAEKFALSKPGIAVTLLCDGGVKLKTPGDGKLKSAVYATLGREFCEHTLAVDYTFGGVEVTGFIGKPEIARPNRNMQNFFINERYIKSGTMAAGLEEGFKSFCPIGKFPACVLFIKLDFRLVDINIHPAKLEVKFTNERPVFEAVMYAVRNALSRGIASFAPEAEDPFALYEPPKAAKFTSDKLHEPEKAIINDSAKESSVFDAAMAKPPELISDNGIVSLPDPGSAAEYGDAARKAAEDGASFAVPLPGDEDVPLKKQGVPSAEGAEGRYTEEKASASALGLPFEKAENAALSSPLSEESGDENGHETGTETGSKNAGKDEAGTPSSASVPGNDNGSPEKSAEADKPSGLCAGASSGSAEKSGGQGDDRKYTAFELSLFDSVPESGGKPAAAPFAGVSDSDTQGELLKRMKTGITVIGEVFNSYILVERNNTLTVIDKHAAHERIIYESLRKGKKDGGTQLLLLPITVNVSAEESIALSENGEYLENVGYVFEEFGVGTILLRGIPAELCDSEAADVFVYLAGQIARAGGRAIGDIFDRALYTASCKAAIKAGTKTSKLSSAMIADIVFSDEAVLYCPHGRPVIVEFPKSKLDRMFSRT